MTATAEVGSPVTVRTGGDDTPHARATAPRRAPGRGAHRGAHRATTVDPARTMSRLALAAAAALLVQALAVVLGRAANPQATVLFWAALLLAYAPATVVLLRPASPRSVRGAAVVLLGAVPTLIYRFTDPLVFGGYDEQLHMRTLVDLAAGHALGLPNPDLLISPDYPGLEATTLLLHQLTGLPLTASAIAVLLLARVLFVLLLYSAASRLLGSAWAGSLAVAAYATSEQFYFFNAQYAYQSLALVFALAGLSLIERARRLTGRPRALLLVGAGCSLAALALTHHVTGWLTLLFLLAWFLAERGPGRRAVGIGLAAGLVSCGVWVAANTARLYAYFAPLVRDLASQVVGAATGQQQRAVFSDGGGYRTPQWEQLLLIGYAVTVTLVSLWVGGTGIWRLRSRPRGARALLPGLSLLAPATFASRVLPSAGQFGDRAATFVFLPLSILLAARLAGVLANSRRGAARLAVAAGLTAAFIGGVLLGAGPNWERLPGRYLVAAENRSIDPEALAAVDWAHQHLAPGTTIVSDRITAALLSSTARLYPTADLQAGADPASVYFAATWTSSQTATIRALGAGYLYVDSRWSEQSPHVGAYFHDGESDQSTSARLDAAQLEKFATVPGIAVAYHRGPITIYDLAAIPGSRPRIQGWTGHRHEPPAPVQAGLGLLLGCAVVLLAGSSTGRSARRAGAVFVAAAGRSGSAAAMLAAACLVGVALVATGVGFGPVASGSALLPALARATAALRHQAVRERLGRRSHQIRARLSRIGATPVLGCLAAALVIIAAALIAVRSAYGADVLAVRRILR